MSLNGIAVLVTLMAVMGLTATGQTVIVWDDTTGPGPATSTFEQVATLSPAYPSGMAIGPSFPGLGLAPVTSWPLGGTAIDNVTGIVYACDGLTIEFQNFPFYPPIVPIMPGSFAYTGFTGPVHGMTIDPFGAPAGGPLLWVTDGVMVTAVLPIPGTPTVVPPFRVVGGSVPVMFPPLTGLDWDPFSATLWAVDSAGFIYNFTAGGTYIGMGPPRPSVLPISAGSPSGLALDKTGPGAGFYVGYAGLAGIIVRHDTSPTIIPTGVRANGVTFHALPARLPGAVTCLPVIPPPNLNVKSPAWSGNGGFALTLTSVAPGSPVVLLIDLASGALLPGGTPYAGGTLYFNPLFSPTLAVVPLGNMPPGLLTINAPLGGPAGPVPAGFQAYVQIAAMDCATSPFISLSDALQVTIALP